MMRYLKDATTLELNVDKCIGCGMCVNVCPHAVFSLKDKKASYADREACMECGACARNCPVEAITVKSGVGCASGIIAGALTGGEPCCGENGKCCG